VKKEIRRMDKARFFETILDSFTDGVYVLDDRGNYIFVNSAYVQSLNMPKSLLLNYNVHDFLKTGQINICISDIVYKEKRKVVMFQDVLDTQNFGRNKFRQLVISTPIFDETGKISNIVAVCRPLDTHDELYRQARLRTTSSVVGAQPAKPPSGSAIIAHSPAMRAVLEAAATVASVDSSVLITGESGTGKEVVAQHIHLSGPRRDRPMVVVNCASIPENLLEAELFGYEKGAFTGALPGGKKGLFEEADGSTLFLDEINSLPLELQGKVLRAIETKTIQRIGSTRSRPVDFRVVAATNEDLAVLVAEKRFRMDLYYRLNVIPIYIPPLRERPEDIIPLALHFLEYFCRKFSKDKVFTPNALEAIKSYPWPGNVRELKNFVERCAVLSWDRSIEVLDVSSFIDIVPSRPYRTAPTEVPNSAFEAAVDARFEQMLANGVTLKQYLDECERAFVNYALRKYRNSYKAASALGTSQTSIIRRKKKFSL